jgi:hypothetical protein
MSKSINFMNAACFKILLRVVFRSLNNSLLGWNDNDGIWERAKKYKLDDILNFLHDKARETR